MIKFDAEREAEKKFNVIEKKVESKVGYYNNGLQAAEIMDMIRIPEGLSNSQVHSLCNVIKRLRRLGLKDDTTIEKDIEKISQELNHIVNGSYV